MCILVYTKVKAMETIYKDIFEDTDNEEVFEVAFYGELNWQTEEVDISFDKQDYTRDQDKLIVQYLHDNYGVISDELEALLAKTIY